MISTLQLLKFMDFLKLSKLESLYEQLLLGLGPPHKYNHRIFSQNVNPHLSEVPLAIRISKNPVIYLTK